MRHGSKYFQHDGETWVTNILTLISKSPVNVSENEACVNTVLREGSIIFEARKLMRIVSDSSALTFLLIHREKTLGKWRCGHCKERLTYCHLRYILLLFCCYGYGQVFFHKGSLYFKATKWRTQNCHRPMPFPRWVGLISTSIGLCKWGPLV